MAGISKLNYMSSVKILNRSLVFGGDYSVIVNGGSAISGVSFPEPFGGTILFQKTGVIPFLFAAQADGGDEGPQLGLIRLATTIDDGSKIGGVVFNSFTSIPKTPQDAQTGIEWGQITLTAEDAAQQDAKMSFVVRASASNTEPFSLYGVKAIANVPLYLNSFDDKSGAGAISTTVQTTLLTSTGVQANTLANGEMGQEKTIIMVADGGDATLTAATAAFTSIVFSAIGQSVTLIWNGKWYVKSFYGVTIT